MKQPQKTLGYAKVLQFLAEKGYPGELVQSSRTDITLDDVLMVLDEHYNNIKALDALNQELFQLWMADKETMSDCGICLSRHLQISQMASSQNA